MSLNSDTKSCQKSNIYLSKEEKEKQVIELYLAKVPYKQIAEIVGMSLRDISRIINEYLRSQKAKLEKSIRSKAFQMFKDKRSLVDVAIELDLPALEVENIHTDYLRLTDKEIITLYFNQIKDYFPDFLKYYKIIKTAKDQQQNKVKMIIDNDYLISIQERRLHELDLENEKSLGFKLKLDLDIDNMTQTYEYYAARLN